MKKILLGILGLFLFLSVSTFAEYQQQGFSQFQELDGNMTFTCTEQCIALVGSIVGVDYVSLRGEFQGNGIVGYGFLVGQQIVPGETIQINGANVIDQQFSFTTLPFYSQLPPEAQLVFMVQGNVTGNQALLSLGFMDVYQKIGQGWKDFRKMETLTPYSINLRYGVKLLGTSIVKYGYWIFFLVGLYLLLLTKGTRDEKYRKIFFLGLGIFLFIGIRNFITYTRIVDQGIKTYTNQSYENKTFFDLGDYLTFTDKIRKELALDTGTKECKIYVDSFQDWPFKAHWESLYLKPCTFTLTGSEADYLLYYKKPIATGDIQKSVLLEFHGNSLLLNK